jgi:hypothetical protein
MSVYPARVHNQLCSVTKAAQQNHSILCLLCRRSLRANLNLFLKDPTEYVSLSPRLKTKTDPFVAGIHLHQNRLDSAWLGKCFNLNQTDKTELYFPLYKAVWSSVIWLASCWLIDWLTLKPWRWRRYDLPKHYSLIRHRMSQLREFFIVSTAGCSKPTE